MVSHQLAFYTVLFFGTLGTVALWEYVAPRRTLRAPLRVRWANNLAVFLLNTVAIWLVFPGFGIGAALVSTEEGWGLLRLVQMPTWLAFVIAFLVMDLTRYAEHVLLHRVPLLWRIHRMHHTDLDFDVTTAVRFHPAEALVVVGIKVGIIALLGPPILAVLIYELTYPLTTFWVHGNTRMPKGWDRALRLGIITPDMHRAHHSVVMRERNSNYGGLLSCWDRLFGTYTEAPRAGHEGMTIGLPGFMDPRHIELRWMLANPLLQAGPRKAPKEEPITAKAES